MWTYAKQVSHKTQGMSYTGTIVDVIVAVMLVLVLGLAKWTKETNGVTYRA